MRASIEVQAGFKTSLALTPGMEQDIAVGRFEELREWYDEVHRPGTWLDL